MNEPHIRRLQFQTNCPLNDHDNKSVTFGSRTQSPICTNRYFHWYTIAMPSGQHIQKLHAFALP